MGGLLRFLRFTLLFALAFAAQKLCCGVTSLPEVEEMKLEERFLNGAGEIRRLAMQTLFERSSTTSRTCASLR
jgi:hypothetical protein